MLRIAVMIVVLGQVTIAMGCGSEEGDEFPDLLDGNLDVEAMEWVVDGMGCGGDDVTRLVGFVDEAERRAKYLRSDDCAERGDQFWSTFPSEQGDEVTILVDAATGRTRTYRVESDGDDVLRLLADGDGEDDDVIMRRVYPAKSPSAIPELSGFDLAGEWWMEGYPCIEELVPQVVKILHPPSSLHLTKIIGDECIGDGESFFDGEVSGTSVSGEARLEEEGGIFDDDDEVIETTGTVRTEHYIRLDVAGQSVVLRRVLGMP